MEKSDDPIGLIRGNFVGKVEGLFLNLMGRHIASNDLVRNRLLHNVSLENYADEGATVGQVRANDGLFLMGKLGA